MSEAVLTDTGNEVVADFSADKQTFHVPWGKAMMWFFLLSDTFIFGSFLTGYMTVRMSVRDAWPVPSEVFALSFGGADAKSVRLSVELCTVYWHYLLLVWIGLFALLLST